MWDVRTGKEVRSFEGHRGALSRLAVSADGQTLLSASWTGRCGLGRGEWKEFAPSADTLRCLGRRDLAGRQAGRIGRTGPGHPALGRADGKEVRDLAGHANRGGQPDLFSEGRPAAVGQLGIRRSGCGTWRPGRRSAGSRGMRIAWSAWPSLRMANVSCRAGWTTGAVVGRGNGQGAPCLQGHSNAVLGVDFAPGGRGASHGQLGSNGAAAEASGEVGAASRAAADRRRPGS